MSNSEGRFESFGNGSYGALTGGEGRGANEEFVG